MMQRLGMTVANVYLLQLNKEYIKDGPIDIAALFSTNEITDQLIELEQMLITDIKDAYQAINESVEPTSCLCRYKAPNRQCGAFPYLYTDTPEYTVYDLSRIGSSKAQLRDMVNQGVIAMEDIVNGIMHTYYNTL